MEPNDAYLFKIFTFDSFLMCASIGVVLRVLYPGLKTPFRPPRIVLPLDPPAHTPVQRLPPGDEREDEGQACASNRPSPRSPASKPLQ